MSKIKRTIKGITYMYEQTSYRDENGRPRTKQKLIGRIDPATGEVAPTRKKKHKTYRIIAKAKASNGENEKRVVNVNANIHALAIPTLHDYEYAISLHQEGNAYLYPIMTGSGLKFEDGEIFFEGELELISAAELKNIPLLTVYYHACTCHFSSPYMNYIVGIIYNASLSRDRKGNFQQYQSGRQILNPSHSYLVKPYIAKERNKAAIENVFIIVKVIEQAGDNGTPRNIPTVTNLDELNFNFPHNGKR